MSLAHLAALLTLGLAPQSSQEPGDLRAAWQAARSERIPAHPRDLRLPPLQPYSPPPARSLNLDRGARLLVIENHELPLVDGSLLFRGAGSASDPAGKEGVAALLADVLRSGGSESTSGPALDDQLDALAASLTVSAESDALRIDFSCLAEDLDQVLEAIGQLLIIPAYPERELEKSRQRALTRLQLRAGSTPARADDELLRIAYGAGAPESRRASEASLKAIERSDLLSFHAERLGIDRMIAGVIGDVQRATLGAQLETSLSRLPRATAELHKEPAVFLEPSRTTIYLIDLPDSTQCEVRVAGPGIRRLDRDLSALSLWSYATGYGSASNRMMRRLRTELGLIYSGGLYFQPDWERAGRLEAYFSTRPDAVGAAISTLLGLLREALAPLPETELQTVRARVQRSAVLEFDRPQEVLARALDLEFHGYPREFWQRHAQRLDDLTPEDIATAVQRHLDPDRLVIVVLGPAALVQSQLSALGRLVPWPEQPLAPAQEASSTQ